MIDRDAIRLRWDADGSKRDERGRRLWAASEVRAAGWGGFMAETTFDTAIERDLQRRYHQPSGVEQFGIEAIPLSKKTVKWYDLFSIILNFLVNPATILRGGLGVAAGVSFQASLAAEFSGIIVAACFYVVMATVGVDYGVPGQVATRFTACAHRS
jgi:cytosine/uracil/thiamine/allantoin permease